MTEVLATIAAALGGLGIFILAIGMMTDGLKAAVGPGLRTLLATWTKTPGRGVAAGFLMTAIVQSSSAVTVASLGFVNAGLMNMRQVLGVIFGANVGTTMTGWLVALVGFEFSIQKLALPLIGIGMIVRLIQSQGRLASAGQVLVGFGLFFMGLDVLKTAFDGVTQTFALEQMTATGVLGIIGYMVIGIIMTILTQSSSATIAITITAASSGVVGLYAAGAMVVGANIGTTSTAIFAAFNATSPAKRAALAQVLFNLGTAVIALIILPVLFYVVELFSQAMGISTSPAISLALFHTLFNIMGLLLIFPHTTRLANWLETRFRTWEEKESHPKYIDHTVARTPALALFALVKELQALQVRVLALFQLATYDSIQNTRQFRAQSTVIKSLSSQISRFIVTLETAELSDETTEQLATLLRVEHYLADCTARIEMLSSAWAFHGALQDEALETRLGSYLQQLHQMMSMSMGDAPLEGHEPMLTMEQLDQTRESLKAALIMAATQHRIEIENMSAAIECMQDAWHIANTWQKATQRISSLTAVLTPEGALQDATTGAA
ncbi:Na/Pi cotransporter family protein [Alteromonas antoniana]|uniref:Na/Pi cotransporter family protein n=1 Tax=Alteromonas antoniana TaxID=2803813 RepID=UPI001C4582E6|nr:Na/Pi symporter [Alteromonas antoniana]